MNSNKGESLAVTTRDLSDVARRYAVYAPRKLNARKREMEKVFSWAFSFRFFSGEIAVDADFQFQL